MKEWILSNCIASEGELLNIENNSKEEVKKAKKDAWEYIFQTNFKF